MALPLLTQYLRQVDDGGPRNGVVGPCDVFKHLTTKGMETRKAAALALVLTVAGGLTTNPEFPLYAKPPPRTRAFELAPPDPLAILQEAGGDLLAKTLAIADALIIPPLLDKEPAGREHWFKQLLRHDDAVPAPTTRHRSKKKRASKRDTTPPPPKNGGLALLSSLLGGLGGGGGGSGLLQRLGPLLGLLGNFAPHGAAPARADRRRRDRT